MWLPAESEEKFAYSMSILSVAYETHSVDWNKDSFKSIRCVMDEDNPLAKN